MICENNTPNILYLFAVSMEIEDAYVKYQKCSATDSELKQALAVLKLDLAKMGTTTKVNNQNTGVLFDLNFQNMKQTNAKSSHSRNMKRIEKPAGPPPERLPDPAKSSDSLVRQLSAGARKAQSVPGLPASIPEEEVLLVRIGQVIQVVAKHEGDDW